MADDKTRHRMVVEEVTDSAPVVSPPIEPVAELKEKVEELQDVTEDITESVEKIEEAPVTLDNTMSDTLPELKNGSGPNPLMIIIPGIFLLGALLGGIVFYQSSVNNQNKINGSPVSTPTPVATDSAALPTSTPAAKLDLTKYPINVMNGSGTPGQAGVVKTLLTTAGFSVSATGNAASYDFTKTIIKTKVDVPASFVTQLSGALSKSYVLDTNQTLATSSADEVQVIIGSGKVQ